MTRTLRFPRPPDLDPAAMLRKARAAGASRGVRFTGELPSGRFEGTAEGTWELTGDEIVIVVDKKPMIVPWGMIEKALRDLFRP
jgi:hypothetical protein